MHLVIALVTLEMSQYKFTISHRGTLYQRESALVPLPLKKNTHHARVIGFKPRYVFLLVGCLI